MGAQAAGRLGSPQPRLGERAPRTGQALSSPPAKEAPTVGASTEASLGARKAGDDLDWMTLT